MNCITVTLDHVPDLHITVFDGKVINVSKHQDYVLFHYKARDVKAFKALDIELFIFSRTPHNPEPQLDYEIIKAEELKTRGVNFKTATRRNELMTPELQNEVVKAWDLAVAHLDRLNATPTQAVSEAPGVVAPDVPAEAGTVAEPEVVSSMPACDGVGVEQPAELVAVQASPSSAPPSEAMSHEAQAGEGPLLEPDDPDDPLSILKPSRKQRRR